jgi:hypothetical protein
LIEGMGHELPAQNRYWERILKELIGHIR